MSRTVLLVMGSGEVGGGATHLLQLVEHLPARGWRPAVAVDPRGPTLERARHKGADVHAIPFMDGRLRPAALAGLHAAIRSVHPDIVHAHGSRAAFALTLLRRLSRLPPLIYTEHGLSTDVERNPFVRWLAAAAERRSLSAADRIVALSEYSCAQIRALAPAVAHRMVVIPNAVPEHKPSRSREEVRRELGIPPEAVVVGTVMRFVPQKAPLDFVEVAGAVGSARPDAWFLAVGDGPLRPEAESAARAAGARVVFTGRRDDVPDLLSAMNVFLQTSRWEGLPIALLEAMAAGLPVVATDVGGVASIIQERITGLLGRSGDVATLAHRTVDLIRDARLRCAMGGRARGRAAQEHAVGPMVGKLADLYDSSARHDGPGS